MDAGDETAPARRPLDHRRRNPVGAGVAEDGGAGIKHTGFGLEVAEHPFLNSHGAVFLEVSGHLLVRTMQT